LTTLHTELHGLCFHLKKEITTVKEREIAGSVYFCVNEAAFKTTEFKGPEFLSHAYIP